MGKVYVAGLNGSFPASALPLSELPRTVTLGAGESFSAVVVVLPGVSCEIPLTVEIDGEGAEVNLSGLYVCGSEEKVTLDINVHHRAGGTLSRQLFNGIAAGKSRTAFHGLIKVEKDSQKIKAFQENHNILLSTDARVETMPQLEIYADDVECSHGATTGFLNVDEQFYMRSRGIPEAEAKVMQMISFLAPVISSIEDEALRGEIAALVENSIRSLEV